VFGERFELCVGGRSETLAATVYESGHSPVTGSWQLAGGHISASPVGSGRSEPARY
jgi:hypothetical protein